MRGKPVPIRRDRILVIDIEATCWDVSPPPSGQTNEIIEIGLCVYDVERDRIVGKRSLLVSPVTSIISPFCTELTTLTPQLLDEQGMDLAEACRILIEEYEARKILWTSWGGFDKKTFRKQCRRLGIGYPFGNKHMDLKSTFAEYSGLRCGMMRALESANLGLIGTLHRGHDDAWNAARILQDLVHRHGLEIVKRYW